MNALTAAFCAATLLTETALAGDAKASWADPKVNSINRLPARAIAVPCESAAKALAVARGDCARTESKYLLSLNGTWDFKWKRTVATNVWEKTGTIRVPSCWQLEGDYDPPLYTNVRYPLGFDGTGDPMASVPRHYTAAKFPNPVGLYARTFEIPADWKGRRVAIHFGGVSSALYVRLNGRDVGYSEDSRLPGEFDLTPYLKDGANTLEAEVIKHCDGTFLEDQDFWRLSGIFRDVWLVAERPAAAKDLVVEASLSDDYAEGTLVVRDENGKELLRKTYARPRLWSCETPEMYYETVETDGDFRAVAFGFRKVEIKNSVLYVNGRRALFMGVNRHEMSPRTGYAVTVDDMKRDLAVFRDFNVNAVRTCHYPNDPTWYELCDRAGVYVVCEANIESHGAGYGAKTLAKNPLFRDAHVERGVNMVKTFRNHPSVIVWSMGNEAGFGPAFEAEYKAMRALDATRPIQYEQAGRSAFTDTFCPMYMRPWACRQYVERKPAKPLILCEYAHAMGNSTGDIHDYWDLVRKFPSMQGGFVWDYADQALWKTDARGTWLAYGGDFGDRPNDDNFNCNGIFDALRNPHPGAFEMRHAYQPIHVDAWDWKAKTARVYNGWRFRSLQGVMCRWTVARDGKAVGSGTLDLAGLAPDTAKDFVLDVPDGDAITFGFAIPGDKDRFGRPREIASDQFVRPFVARTVASGTPASLDGLRLNFWRAPTDNDRGWGMARVCGVWKKATETQVLPDGVTSDLKVTGLGPNRYLVDWTLDVTATNLPPIPRVGLTFRIPAALTNVAWYGLGPWENYRDRARAARLGEWTATAGLVRGLADANGRVDYPANALNPDTYVEPGEQGHRGGCRRVTFSDGGTAKVSLVAVNAPFGFNAWPYAQAKLEKAKHQPDLKAEDALTVSVDAAMMGVGGDNSWGNRPHDDDMLKAGTYRLVLELLLEGGASVLAP